jgi:hypothetical protein
MMSDNEDADAQGAGSHADSSEAEEVVSHRLRREEREDLVHSLEHIVTVGSHIRRTIRRTNEWRSSQLQGGAQTIGRILHAEDVRIYGSTSGYRQSTWPVSVQATKRVIQNDGEWDQEHGDSIHPLAFQEARLSDIPPSKRQRIDGPNLSVDKTDCVVSLDEVPRAMLVRCWERAVHAAGSTIHSDGVIRQEDESIVQPDTTSSYSYDNAVKKCQDLNIHFAAHAQACPTCGSYFDSSEDLRLHFFGSQRRGCCWTKIRMTQYELLNQVLRKEVADCANGLVRMIMPTIGNRQIEGGEGSLPVRSWKHVIHVLESTYASAHAHQASSEPTVEKMRHEPRMTPLAFNSKVLESVTMRLAERYANMPR